MVHRPADTRLLVNLLSHEKDYSKHLQSLLDSSHASLASFSAFAAASSPPLSQIILAIAALFSSADDALRRYKDAVDAWREQLKTLKDFEAEISNIARDRDILVTRLLKASKNEKPPKDKDRNSVPSRRTSVANQGQRFPSSSTLSLSADHSASTHTLNASLPTSTKLAAAQAELQACEAQLATKEREIERSRITAVRDGLRIRCNALIQCGRTWVVMGKDASSVLESLHLDEAPPSPVSVPLSLLQVENRANLGHHYLSSDQSSIGPSQSASQVNMNPSEPPTTHPHIIPNAPPPILGANGSDIQPETFRDATSTAPVFQPYEPISRPHSTSPGASRPLSTHSPYDTTLRPQASRSLNNITSPERHSGYEYSQIRIPPAHAITDTDMPMPTVLQSDSRPPAEAARRGSGYWTPVSNEEGQQAHPPKLAPAIGAPRVMGPATMIEDGPAGHHLSREERLVEEGKLVVVENPRYHQQQQQPQAGGVPESPRIETKTVVMAVDDDEPQAEDLGLDIGEVRTEVHAGDESSELQIVGHPSDAPTITGGPQTLKKDSKQSAGTSQRVGLLSSLKRVFSGNHRRDMTAEREEKAREKQEKARLKEEKAREREEEKKGKAREREEKKEEKVREREEKREEQVRDREGKSKDKQKQKKERERRRQIKTLVPDSSDESAGDDNSLRRRDRSGPSGGFMGAKKKDEKWATRTDKNLDELRRENREADAAEGHLGGFVVKKNKDLEKNLRGGVVGGHRSPVDLRGWEGGGAAASSVSLGSVGSGAGGGRKLKKGGRAGPINGGNVSKGGARGVRSLSMSEGQNREGATGTGFLFAPPIPPPVPSSTEGRFKENFNSFASSSKSRGEIAQDKGYASDATTSAPPIRTPGLQTGPSYPPDTHNISVPSIERPSKKKTRASVTQTDGEDSTNLGRNTSVLACTSASMGTGVGDRRGSVDVPPTTGRVARGASHPRATSLDYGRSGLPAMTLGTPQVTPGAGKPQESLMSIVDNVTRANRHAWDAGLMGSKTDRSKRKMSSGVGETVGTTGTMSGGGSGVGVNGVKVNDAPSAVKGGGVMGEVVRAPPRLDREVLLSSLRGTSGSPGRGQPVTTAYTVVRTEVDGISSKKPLKSAMRNSRSPSPHGVLQRSNFNHGYATGTGREEPLPSEILPSLSSLPLEDQKVPSPTGQVRSVGGGRGGVGKRISDDDGTSTSSYETGHEDFESGNEDQRRRESSSRFEGLPLATSTPISTPRRMEDATNNQDLTYPQLAMPSPIRPGLSTSDMTPTKVETTPQRRKSVRVSLKPTFSPTPPAIEGEEDQVGRAPFVFQDGAQAVAPPSVLARPYRDGALTPPPLPRVPVGYVGSESKTTKDVWDDDSDDNMEYQAAKQRLQKASREQAGLRKLR